MTQPQTLEDLDAALVQMMEERPEAFDYRIGSIDRRGCGCVVAHFGNCGSDGWLFGELTRDEERYIAGLPAPRVDPTATSFASMSDVEACGLPGLTEARRRLAVVQARVQARQAGAEK